MIPVQLPTGRLRWAPGPNGGAFRVRLEGKKAKDGTVLVRWLEGPLGGSEARLDARSLRATRIDAANYVTWEELE